jgi:hypothetical protein
MNGEKKRPIQNNVMIDTGSNSIVVPKADLRFILEEICTTVNCYYYKDDDIVIETGNFLTFPHWIKDCANVKLPSLNI